MRLRIRLSPTRTRETRKKGNTLKEVGKMFMYIIKRKRVVYVTTLSYKIVHHKILSRAVSTYIIVISWPAVLLRSKLEIRVHSSSAQVNNKILLLSLSSCIRYNNMMYCRNADCVHTAASVPITLLLFTRTTDGRRFLFYFISNAPRVVFHWSPYKI